MNKPSKPNRHLAKFLASFNATWLGEGDINAGTNLLVARAITLANLSRTGSGIQPPNLSRIRASCNLLVSGGLSSDLVTDQVVTEIGIRQNNLIAGIRRLIGDKIADARKDGPKAIEFPTGPGANASENALFQLEQDDTLVSQEPLQLWAEVLNFPPNPRIDDLAARPKFLVAAKGPKHLDRQLGALHGNRPLVAIGLNTTTDAQSYAETCNGLLGGPFPVEDSGETVCGNLLVTTPGHVLAQFACQAGEPASWLDRMVWLVDGKEGPDAVENVPSPGRFHVSDTAARFGEALNAVLAKRLNNHEAGTVVHDFDFAQTQIRWVDHLKEMEVRLPDISGTARRLLATLAFGLIELAKAPNCKQLAVTPEGVEALGRWVIKRMANARAEMLHSAELEWRMQMAQRIFLRVEQGPLSVRDIYRAVGLQADLCRELLGILESLDLLCCQERTWRRVEGAVFSDSIRHQLALAA